MSKDKRVPMVPNPWDHRQHLRGEIACWQPRLTSVDNDIRPELGVNRARGRELAITAPHAVNATETVRDAVIGRRFALALNPISEYLGVSDDEKDEWSKIAEAEWRRYAETFTFDVDATRKNTFTFLMHQVMEGFTTDGEAVGIVRAKEGWAGYLTCLQMIEPERLEEKNSQFNYGASNEIRFGIERDHFGEPIAYHVKDTHDGDVKWSRPGAQARVRRIPRYDADGRPQVLHVFDDFRPGQTRGIARGMVAALKMHKMFQTFSEATLSKAVMSANYAAVVTSDLPYEQAMAVLGANGGDTYGNNLTTAAAAHLSEAADYYNHVGLSYNGAKVVHLMPNEKLEIVQGQSDGVQQEAFQTMFLRQLAAALNISYEELSRDFSGVTYSSARQSMILMWRRYLRMRELLVAKFAMPFVSCWMQEAVLTKRLPMLGKFKATEEGWRQARHALCAGGFVSWGQPIIDPVKEMTGKNMAMAMGLDTLRDAAAETGEDWGSLLRQRAREMKERARLGLNVNGVDPTLVIGGNAKAGNPSEAPKAKSNSKG